MKRRFILEIDADVLRDVMQSLDMGSDQACAFLNGLMYTYGDGEEITIGDHTYVYEVPSEAVLFYPSQPCSVESLEALKLIAQAYQHGSVMCHPEPIDYKVIMETAPKAGYWPRVCVDCNVDITAFKWVARDDIANSVTIFIPKEVLENE